MREEYRRSDFTHFIYCFIERFHKTRYNKIANCTPIFVLTYFTYVNLHGFTFGDLNSYFKHLSRVISDHIRLISLVFRNGCTVKSNER